VKADPDAQRRLLDLQAIDTALAQLAHRRRTLPELAEVERLNREIAALEAQRAQAQVAVDDIDRDIARLEKDIDQVRVRADKDRGRLDAGTGPARELEALQHELATLTRRQSELEDAELELMEQREQSQGALDQVDERVGTSRDARTETEAKRDAVLAEVDAERQTKAGQRDPLVAELPADLVALYEKIRESSGLGAALLRAGRCEGCRLELSGSERSRFRTSEPDEVLRCEECGRILVRTAESGL
jgi:predicted  nucleic acid-binding Zn-ribbon protein